MRERDNQRQRVYSAENTMPGIWGQSIPNNQLQAWVDAALDKRAIRSRWGARRIEVTLGRGGARARNKYEINLGKRSRNPFVICHELAHCLTPWDAAAHGPEFAGVELFLVQHLIGPEAARQLRAAFRAKKVRTNRKGIPAVQKSVAPARAVREKRVKDENRERAIAVLQRMIAGGQISKAEAIRVIQGTRRMRAVARP